MRVLVLIFSSFMLTGAGQNQHMRIASTSVCGDAYVLSLARPKDIYALSWQSNDMLSSAPQDLRQGPKAWDDVERLLALNPSLVVFGPGEGALAKPLLTKAGIKHINVQWGEDFASVENNNQKLAKTFGTKPAQVPFYKDRHKAEKPLVLYLTRSGGSAGPGTYVDAAIARAGGKNIITKSGWHTPDPELLASLQPSLIITSFFEDGYSSVNEAGLQNKILKDKVQNTPHINVPGKLWPCAGPSLYEATRIISSAIAKLSQ